MKLSERVSGINVLRTRLFYLIQVKQKLMNDITSKQNVTKDTLSQFYPMQVKQNWWTTYVISPMVGDSFFLASQNSKSEYVFFRKCIKVDTIVCCVLCLPLVTFFLLICLETWLKWRNITQIRCYTHWMSTLDNLNISNRKSFKVKCYLWFEVVFGHLRVQSHRLEVELHFGLKIENVLQL
jgi:hypothetical protein